MFTGIVSKVAKIESVAREKGGLVFRVAKPKGWKVARGESVAVNGICSTVVRGGRDLHFEYMPETLARTTLQTLRKGDLVNLERSLRAADPISGHFVSGHIDAVGKIRDIVREGNSRVLTLSFPPKFSKLVAEKGSLAIDGVSFTVVRAARGKASVKAIPYTWNHTILSSKNKGSVVNLEFDLLAKYLARIRA